MRATCMLLVVGVLVAQDAAPPLTREHMAADLRQLAAETRRKWAYAELRRPQGVDPTAMAEALVPRLDGLADDAAFVGLVREFVAGLRDGHAYAQWPGHERRPFRRWPFTFVDTAEGLMVDELLPSWTGAPVGLERGDLLLAVDGVAIADLRAAAERTTNASTDTSRRAWALAELPFSRNDPARYEVQRADGSRAVVGAPAAARLPQAIRSKAVENRPLGDGVHYVRIPTFALADAGAWARASPAERPVLLAKDIAAIRAAFAAAGNHRALVLDLRGNGGGTDLLGMEVAACLLPAGTVYYGLASKGLFGNWPKPGFHRLRVQGDPPRFAGQLVVLVDEHVFSVTDNLCRCLDDQHGDVTFVGRPTGGGTGAPRPAVTLRHSGIVVGFCTMRVYGPKGQLIEGSGTPPDVLVARTRAGVLAGRDEDLAAALRAVR